MQRGLFVTFEGVDGSGKTTQLNLFKEYLDKKKIKNISLREPGGTEIGEKIRTLILDKNNQISPKTEALLYAAARSELVFKVIEPSIETGYVVICDRFLDSSIAYQGVARNLGSDEVKNVNLFATNGLIPNITFFMDIPPKKALERRKNATELDRIELEKMDFHENVYNGYKMLCQKEKERIISLDALEEPFIIHKKIVELFETKFKEVIL